MKQELLNRIIELRGQLQDGDYRFYWDEIKQKLERLELLYDDLYGV